MGYEQDSRCSSFLLGRTAKHAPSGASTTGLMNSTRAADQSQLRKDNIKARVGYEWKNIYKNLTRADVPQIGAVSRAHFQQACSSAGVSLSKDQVKRIGMLFSHDGDSASIDYVRMSKELNLHYSSLNFIQQRVQNAHSLKQILSKPGKMGKTDLKHLNTQELR